MGSSPDADHYDREPRGDSPERLSQQDKQREEGEYEHRPHPGGIRIEPCPVDDQGRKLPSVYRQHRDGIEGEYQGDAERIRSLDPELRVQVGRRPEKEEPPDSVSHEFPEGKGPCLPVS